MNTYRKSLQKWLSNGKGEASINNATSIVEKLTQSEVATFYIALVESQNKLFQQGYVCAVSCIVSGHGASTETREALKAGGLDTLEKLRNAGADEYDINILTPLINEISREKN